jgi:hypothetical protein
MAVYWQMCPFAPLSQATPGRPCTAVIQAILLCGNARETRADRQAWEFVPPGRQNDTEKSQKGDLRET